ncbi:hypothetical protein DdX_18391 [Ditylenchus destructor]|uniref:Uncharacterized protein n=1 Tax=Ditylenchus destructor TaxID=166010 RepID=A0AAD4MKW9_9BILA|nr:hypothetical protein DdX_18391 [Ditylenchus destructor]
MMSICNNFVVFDDKIPTNEEKQFFTELGISSNVPVDVQYENAFIGLSSKNSASKSNSLAMSLRGTAQDIQQPIIFSGRSNNHQEHSWAALKYFLEFLYYPAMYTKKCELIPYGNDLDTNLSKGIDVTTSFTLNPAFPIFGQLRTEISIKNDGTMTFGDTTISPFL